MKNSLGNEHKTKTVRNQRIVLFYFLTSLGFGLAMGAVFPVYAMVFVDFKSPNHAVIFVSGCLVAGAVVGLISFLIGRWRILNVIDLIAKRLSSLGTSSNRFHQEIGIQSSDAVGRLVEAFDSFLSRLNDAVKRIHSTSEEIREVTQSLSSSSLQSAATSEQMLKTTDSVTEMTRAQDRQMKSSNESLKLLLDGIDSSDVSSQQMAAQFFLFTQYMEANRRGIERVTNETTTTTELSNSLQKAGDSGQEVLTRLAESVSMVVKRTEEIQEIVEVILSIASETNLLSMNAAIEAAHAGDAGKGFSVVADEIRKLADTSSGEGRRIESLIVGILASVDEMFALSKETNDRFSQIQSGIVSVQRSCQTILNQMNQQINEDHQLSEGIAMFSQHYEELSETLRLQVSRSQTVRESIERFEEVVQAIGTAMVEQSAAMGESTQAILKTNETVQTLNRITGQLTELTSRFG